MRECIIIGGGVIGLCSAYYLSKAGHKVTVIDASDLKTGASLMNAGLIVPSHFQPLASPKMLASGIQMFFDRLGPLFIKPRLDPDFISWMYHFVRASARNNMEHLSGVIWNLNMQSLILYQEILEEQGMDFHFEKSGLLMAYQTKKAREKELENLAHSKKFGAEAFEMTSAEIQKLQPKVKMNILGGVYYPCDAHSTPSMFIDQLVSFLKNKGVQFILNQKVQSVISKPNDTRYGVKTKHDEYQADHVIVCAGIWSQDLLKPLGVRMVMQAGKGYSFDQKIDTGIKIPSLLTDARVAVTPMRGFTRFAGTMELTGKDSKIYKQRVAAIVKAIQKFYPELYLEPSLVSEVKYGFRPLSFDGLPYIGELDGYKGLILGTGHAMMGWSLAPLTGKLVQQIVDCEPTSINMDKVSPNRKK